MDKIVFTPSAVVDFLSQIKELDSYDIGILEDSDRIQITIGDSVYDIDTYDAEEIPVDNYVVEDIDDINQMAYSELPDSQYDGQTTIESGIIKQLAKTLLVGGLVRFTWKLLR